jgi:hypothetical protein
MSTLTKYLTLLPTSLSIAEKIEYTQLAYNDIIKKFKLDPVILPLKFTLHTKIDGFVNKGVMVGSLSEVAIKEIISLNNCDVLSSDQDFGTPDTPLFGDILAVDYGFTDFDLVNNSQSEHPEIYQIGSSIVCTSVPECFTLLTGYMYPYFCTTSDGWLIDRHYYDIQTMVTTYGADNLIVDDVLLALCTIHAIGKYYEKNGDLNRKDIYHKFAVPDCINLFNTWKETIRNDNLENVGYPDVIN